MKKKLVIMVLALLCATKICSFEYKLEDILLTYMAFIEHSNLFINRGILFLNPNQNSRIHYAEYEFDSGGNKILKVFDSEMDFEKMNLMTLFIIKIIELVGSDVVITDGISK